MYTDGEPGTSLPQLYPYYSDRSVVSLLTGESRRKNITDPLAAIDDQIRPVLKTKKYVVLKANCVSTVPLAAISRTGCVDGVGSLLYCHQAGLGQYDLEKIDIGGPPNLG